MTAHLGINVFQLAPLEDKKARNTLQRLMQIRGTCEKAPNIMKLLRPIHLMISISIFRDLEALNRTDRTQHSSARNQQTWKKTTHEFFEKHLPEAVIFK